MRQQPESIGSNVHTQGYSHRNNGQFTLRAVLTGLFIGFVACSSNVYFGLQTGYAVGVAMPASLIGFGLSKLRGSPSQHPLSVAENVLISTIAGAMSFMPVTGSFVGVIPALEHLVTEEENGPVKLKTLQLLLWALGLILFGLVSILPLREYFIVYQRLPFPSATATAILISTLHQKAESVNEPSGLGEDNNTNSSLEPSESSSILNPTIIPEISPEEKNWRTMLNALWVAACGSGLCALMAYFVPVIHNLPLFGRTAATRWMWTFNLSLGYIGQGIFTGHVITIHMLLGAIVGWAILSPIANLNGWAPGDVDDWEHGSRGWILWISLTAILADCSVKLLWLTFSSVMNYISQSRRCKRTPVSVTLYSQLSSEPQDDTLTGHYTNDDILEEAESSIEAGNDLRTSNAVARLPAGDKAKRTSLPPHFVVLGLPVSVLVCAIAVKSAFSDFISVSAIILATGLSLPLGLVGVQALGEVDYIPASAIGKFSQFIFALVIPKSNPSAIIINLIAGALAEAGACQAGDLSFDLKVAYDLGVPAMDQFYGQVLGAVAGAFVSGWLYTFYSKIYPVPGPTFQVPSAYVWVSAARLFTGNALPEQVVNFAIPFGSFFVLSAAIKARYPGQPWQPLIPSGVAFAIGMYNAPSFTLARVLGGLIEWYCSYCHMDKGLLMACGSGLVLGEGLVGILNLGLAALDVPHLS